jgi:hypothetical protein
VKSDESEDLVWVSENTKDFANPEESSLHQNLLEELRAVGASERVTWLPKLGDAVLRIAGKYNPDVQNLGLLHRRVQEETLHTFLDETVLPLLVEQSVSPRKCALPLGSGTALIAAVGQVNTLEWTPRGAVEGDETVVEFSARAETVLLITMDARLAADDPTLTTVAIESGEVTVQLVKTLVMRGLLTLDKWDRPQRGEVTQMEALADDPRRSEWLAYDVAQTVRDDARVWQMPYIPPELLKPVKMPYIPPELLKPVKMPYIPPDLFKSLWPDPFKGKGFAPTEGPPPSEKGEEEPPPSSEVSDEDAPPPASRGDSEPTDDHDEPWTHDDLTWATSGSPAVARVADLW